MLSLTVDVRAVGGGRSARVSAVGQVLNLQIWATVTGKNADPTTDGLADVMGDFLSSKFSSASVNGNLAVNLIPGFMAEGSVPGVIQDINGDGNLDVGQSPTISTFQAFQHYFVRSGFMSGPTSQDAFVAGGSLEFVIGQISYTVTKLNQGGETDINFVPANDPGGVPGLWKEDGIVMNSVGGQGTTQGTFIGGAPFVITDAATASAPVALASSFYAQQDTPTRVAPLGVDTSIESLVPSSVVVTSPATHGTAVLQSDGSFIYTSTGSYLGTDSFTYTVADVDGVASNPATVTLTIGNTAAPVAGNVTISAPLSGFVDVPVLSSDLAAKGLTLNPASVSLLTLPSHGTAAVQPDGSILFTDSSLPYIGTDSFTYNVADSLGHVSSSPGTVTLTIARAPAPVAGSVTATALPGQRVTTTIAVLPHDTASPGLFIEPGSEVVITQPSHGSADARSISNLISYTPVNGFSGIDSFTYTVTDSAGTTSAPGTVTVYVTDGTVSLTPVANNDSASTASGAAVSIPVLSNDTASTFATLNSSTVTLVSNASHGTTAVQRDGTIQYLPALGFVGTDTFTYTVKDSTGLTSNAAVVSVEVKGILTGKVIGTSGSYHNLGNTIAKVFDGNLSTFFDAPTGNGNWVGLDLSKQYTITQINYAPRPGWANRMVGGQFQGSNDPSFATGVVPLGTITAAPSTGSFTSFAVSSPGAFRYIRYLSPAASFGNVAEIQFFGQPATQTLNQLTGTVIGTAGSYQNQGNGIANVFDGNLNTFFDAPTASGAWAGLDLGSAHSLTQISYAPRSGFAYRMQGGVFQASNSVDFSSGVVTLYTVAGKPASNTLTTVSVSVPGTYRYVRYLGPANAVCNVAEVVFYGT